MLAPIFATAAVAAAAAPAPAVEFAYEVGVVSDYRFRGVSLSDEKPALQVGATASFANGLYVGAWGSTIDEYASEGDTDGATVEVDFNAGWAFSTAGFDVDLGLAAYTYPRAQDLAYLEAPISIARSFGQATLTLGGAYAPSQSALGHKDNSYVYAGGAWRARFADFNLQAGYEHGAFAPGGKWDWQAGVAHRFGPLRAELTYIDTDEPGVDAGLIAGVKVEF